MYDTIKLVRVSLKEFRKTLYKNYKKIFPSDERKSYKILKRTYKLGVTKFFEIRNNHFIIGFMITNEVKDNKFVQLDYFAIFKEYQSRGYGSKALSLLKNEFKDYFAIFGEVEALGYGSNEYENKQREKRYKFYIKNNFRPLSFNILFFNVVYTPYVMELTRYIDDNEIIKNALEIYKVIAGNKLIDKNFKVID